MKQFTQEGMFNELSKVTRAINNKNMSKYDLPTYGTGGEDPVKPVDTDKDYLIRMANSPLFVERYARMVGKPIDQVGEEAEAYRQQILNNIETVKINDVGVYPDKVTKRKQSESIKGAYYPPVKIENEEIEEIQKNINEAPEFIRKYLQNNFDKTLAKLRSHDHNLFMYDDNPWTRTHELSHASVKGHINDKNVNTYPFKDFSDFPELGKYYEGRKEYLISPDEQKARIDVGRKYLEKKGLYDPVNEPFTKKHYDLLLWENVKSAFDKNKEMPYDIDEIMSPYDEETTIKMFNDFVSNDSNQSYDKAQYGGLTKFQDGGGTEYTYSGRPDSRYKKINNQWYINNSTTGGNFVPIEDPNGRRTTILNNEAVIRNSSYADRPKSYMSSRLPDILPSETTQMFKPITQNAVMDFTNNMNKGFAKQHANISRASQAIKENVKSIEQNKSYTKKQKDELIKDEYSRLLDYDKRTDLENAGAWLNNHEATHFVQAGGSEPKTAGDYAERTWDIITNPFDAAKYSISGGGLENMPWHYNTLKDLGYDPSAQSYQERFSGSEGKSNMVGDVLNSFNLFDAGDKVYRNAEKGNWSDAGLEALRFLEVGAFMKPGMLGKLAKTNPADFITKLADAKYTDKLEGYLRKKAIDVINPFDNVVQSLKGNTNAIDLKRKLKSFNIHPQFEDLSKGEKVFNKVKNESLEFWKTPEGKRRVKLYLDENHLTEQGITPEMYSDMMSDLNFAPIDKVKNIREVQTAIDKEREILRKEKYLISQEIKRLEKQLTRDTTITKQGAESNVSKIDELTKRLDNLNDIDEGHLQSLVNLPNYPTNNAYYSPKENEIFIGEEHIKPSNVEQTSYHEWGHGKHLLPHMKIQESFPGYFDALGVDVINPIGKSRPLNMRLRDNLDFENMDIDANYSDLPEHLQNIDFKKLYKNAQSVSSTGVDKYTDPETYWKNSAGYFRHNDEANTFLQELIPELINRGMIEKYGDHIDPQMIDELFKQYRTEAANKIIEPVRLLDIVKPTAKSIQNITNELNDLHIIAPVGIGLGAAAAYESLNQESPLPKNLKFGGNISNLQKFIK